MVGVVCEKSNVRGGRVMRYIQLWGLLCLYGASVFAMATEEDKTLRYLALGDSYTIGESVDEASRWPNQLARLLMNEQRVDDDIRVDIIARTGWTTSQLQAAIERQSLSPHYDMVSLLIGVNNQFQGQNIRRFEDEFAQLLQTAIALADGNRERVVVVSIPDYGVTPFGRGYGAARIAQELDNYNAIQQRITQAAGVRFVDITAHSRKVLDDSSLIANDGLHPSARMYAYWAEQVMLSICTDDGLVCSSK